MKKRISSGAKWEDLVGYSRAVRVDNRIFIAGTTSVNENGEVAGKGNAYEQTRQILEKISRVLEKAGSGLDHVVRTRMFVTDISCWQEIGRAHGEFFSDIKPASTMVEVNALVDKDMLVEIEADALIPVDNT